VEAPRLRGAVGGRGGAGRGCGGAGDGEVALGGGGLRHTQMTALRACPHARAQLPEGERRRAGEGGGAGGRRGVLAGLLG
jgi:hypothetical protein